MSRSVLSILVVAAFYKGKDDLDLATSPTLLMEPIWLFLKTDFLDWRTRDIFSCCPKFIMPTFLSTFRLLAVTDFPNYGL